MSPHHTPYWPSFHGSKTVKQDKNTPLAPSAQLGLSHEEKQAEALRYIAHYPIEIVDKIKSKLSEQSLHQHLLTKYPEAHEFNSNKLLRSYTNEIKAKYMRSSERLNKICFDDKLHLVHHALGTQSFISLAHGGRLKARRELRVSSLFKHCPEPLLRMIVVHELAHLKEKDHNQAFYRLCVHMEPNYHQLEFDARLYLIQQELFGPLYG